MEKIKYRVFEHTYIVVLGSCKKLRTHIQKKEKYVFVLKLGILLKRMAKRFFRK
jgi:hypothetical protein